MILNSHSDRSTIEASELRRSSFSPSRPTLSSSLVTNIWISLDCSKRSSLWLRTLLFFAHSLHSRPAYPFPRCARLVGWTLALWVISRAFSHPSRLARILTRSSTFSRLVAHRHSLLLPPSISIHSLCPTILTHALSSTFTAIWILIQISTQLLFVFCLRSPCSASALIYLTIYSITNRHSSIVQQLLSPPKVGLSGKLSVGMSRIYCVNLSQLANHFDLAGLDVDCVD